MSRIHRALALACALALPPSLAHADDPYADFRVPDHRSFSWIVQSSGGLNSIQRDAGGLSHAQSANGQLLSDMAWVSETEARQRQFAFVTDARWNQAHDRFDARFSFDE